MCFLDTCHISIANDRDMNAWIILHFTNQCPVSLTSIHLRTGASMNGQSLYTAVLQLFGKVGDNQVVVIPT